MLVEEWLGKDNKIGLDIWHKKYQHDNETFDEWLDRICNGNDEIKELIIKKKFLFAGRILANRGLDKLGEKVTLSNCYVLSAPEDNIESIFDTAKGMARTFSYGGGVGIDISKLAPKGAKVHNTAKETSGAISFMDLYSLVTGLIGQNGRRGALMISISCEHPDIEDFITLKSDLTKVNFANISVRVTDEFMQAVDNDEDILLKFKRPETGEVIKKKVNAKKIFDTLCYQNWDYAEPGILYWDKITNWNLLSTNNNFDYAGVNPCLTGDTLIQTVHGEVPIKDLVDTEPYVYCRDDNNNLMIKKASKVWMTRKDASLVKIVSKRAELKCTPDHLILTRNRGWVAAKDLKHGDKLVGLNRMMAEETHVSIGLSGNKKYIPEHRFVAGAFVPIDNMDVHHIDGDELNNDIDNLQVLTHSEHSKLTNLGHKCYCPQDEKTGRFINKSTHDKRRQFNLNKGVGTNWFVDHVEFLDEKEDVYDMTIPEVHNFIANGIVVHNCAEEPLPAGGSCCLCSINLSAYVENGEFNFREFSKDVKTIVTAQNEVLTEGLILHPLQEQKDSVNDWRQIGIGVMGLADCLIKQELTYGSKESLKFVDKMGKILINSALQQSANLAAKYGPYPKYTDEVLESEFFKENANSDTVKLVQQFGLYNSQLLTTAPTGSLSTMLGISGGIEPIFSSHYTRTTKSLHGHDETYDVYTGIFKEYMDEHNITNGEDLPEWFVVSADIKPIDRVKFQGTMQKHIDASISSTVNLPHLATIDDVKDIYMEAWKNGLKGITIFRDGCKRIPILKTINDTIETIDDAFYVKDCEYVKWVSRHTIVADDNTIESDSFIFYPSTTGKRVVLSYNDRVIIRDDEIRYEYNESNEVKTAKEIILYRDLNERFINFKVKEFSNEIAAVTSVTDVGKEGYEKVEWGTVLPVRTDLDGMKTRIYNGCGDFHFQLFYDDKTGRPWETFINMGGNGGCERNLENISKFVSKCLRAGVDINDIIETLKQTRPCSSFVSKRLKGNFVSPGSSCPSAMGFALEQFMKKINEKSKKECPVINKEVVKELKEELKTVMSEPKTDIYGQLTHCPECGAELVHDGGCVVCKACGQYSKCE